MCSLRLRLGPQPRSLSLPFTSFSVQYNSTRYRLFVSASFNKPEICAGTSKESKDIHPHYRPWRPVGLQEVKAPTLLRQTANRWRHGCQPYAPAAFYPQVDFLRFLVLISVRGWVDPRAIVRPEGLGQFKKIHLIGTWTRDFPAFSILPPPLRLYVWDDWVAFGCMNLDHVTSYSKLTLCGILDPHSFDASEAFLVDRV
jgi:hypothetical protein